MEWDASLSCAYSTPGKQCPNGTIYISFSTWYGIGRWHFVPISFYLKCLSQGTTAVGPSPVLVLPCCHAWQYFVSYAPQSICWFRGMQWMQGKHLGLLFSSKLPLPHPKKLTRMEVTFPRFRQEGGSVTIPTYVTAYMYMSLQDLFIKCYRRGENQVWDSVLVEWFILTTRERWQSVFVPGTACVTCPVVFHACMCIPTFVLCVHVRAPMWQGFGLLSKSDSSLQEWDLHYKTHWCWSTETVPLQVLRL